MAQLHQEQKINYIGRIPVRNLWLLMLYASDLFRSLDHDTHSSMEDNIDELPDLIAQILCKHVDQRLRKNLSVGYKYREATLSRVRGRIDHLTTVSHRLMQRGKIACSFNELTLNTPRNCYVRAALLSIARIVHNTSIEKQCRMLASTMYSMGVIGDVPRENDDSVHRFARYDIHDKPMVDAARLAFELALPSEELGSSYLTAPEKEIKWVRKLFEKGIAGFYQYTLKPLGWKVKSGKQIDWPLEQSSSRIKNIFPKMVLDILLKHKKSKQYIIIDTKFNSIITQNKHDQYKLRSSYIYQMYAYLRSQENSENIFANKGIGILLHPSIGEMFFEHTTIQEHEFRFATVDLTALPLDIKDQLIKIIG